jgi:hypothetical protein
LFLCSGDCFLAARKCNERNCSSVKSGFCILGSELCKLFKSSVLNFVWFREGFRLKFGYWLRNSLRLFQPSILRGNPVNP